MTQTSGDLTLCGWRVRSEWPLPELLPWTGGDRPVDLTIRTGEVPARLPGAVDGGPLVQVNADGLLRYSIRDVADYLVREGREVVIDTRLPAETPDVALFLLGSVFGFLCHQRGLLPLHASCVTFGDRAIAFAGPSGVGKSTVAAALLAGGAKLVSDDVTVIDVHAEGGPVVLPSFPRQKLWRDTLTALSITPGRRLRGVVDLEKFDRPVLDRFHPDAIPLAMICQLRSLNIGRTLEIEGLRGVRSMRMLQNNVYRRRSASLMGLSAQQFRDVGLLAQQVPQRALRMPINLPLALELAKDLPSRLETAG